MSSGSYFPKPVRRVEILEKNGKIGLLGIPTVKDRVAWMVLRNRIEPLVNPIFYEDSDGYHPRKSVLDAAGQARKQYFV